jgi:hypothetical protein
MIGVAVEATSIAIILGPFLISTNGDILIFANQKSRLQETEPTTTWHRSHRFYGCTLCTNSLLFLASLPVLSLILVAIHIMIHFSALKLSWNLGLIYTGINTGGNATTPQTWIVLKHVLDQLPRRVRICGVICKHPST